MLTRRPCTRPFAAPQEQLAARNGELEAFKNRLLQKDAEISRLQAEAAGRAAEAHLAQTILQGAARLLLHQFK